MTDEALHHAETHDALEGIAPPSAATRLVGHSKAIEQLERSASAGHHAVILEGVSGIGKATAAFILAKLQMGAKGSFADGVDAKDPVHRQIAQGAHPNLSHVTRPWSSQTKKWKTGSGVDQIEVLDLEDDRPNIETSVFAREILSKVMTLPDPLRTAVVLVSVEGFNCREAAAFLGIASTTFSSRLSRARAELSGFASDERQAE